MPPLPPEASLDDVKVRIRECYRNPNIRNTKQVVLKEGPRAFRVATLFEIVDPKTSKFHHYSLRIDSINRKKSGWFGNAKNTVSLNGDNPDEIAKLIQFLQAAVSHQLPDASGDIHIIGSADYDNLEHVIDALPNLAASDRIELVKSILTQLDGSTSDIDEFVDAFTGAPEETIKQIGVAARVVEHRRAFRLLLSLIEDPATSEHQLQRFLGEHPWTFGSEYSLLIDKRTWTRDEQLDFMLRRTVDNYLEIIEIKTPFKDALFRFDESHDNHYPSATLSKAIGQVMRYIEEVDRNRNSILAKDGYDTLKTRARIIIGRDGDPGQQVALRNLNSHLNRVEILTFDQLLRIAKRVLTVFEPSTEEGDSNDALGEMPF